MLVFDGVLLGMPLPGPVLEAGAKGNVTTSGRLIVPKLAVWEKSAQLCQPLDTRRHLTS